MTTVKQETQTFTSQYNNKRKDAIKYRENIQQALQDDNGALVVQQSLELYQLEKDIMKYSFIISVLNSNVNDKKDRGESQTQAPKGVLEKVLEASQDMAQRPDYPDLSKTHKPPRNKKK